MSTITDDGAIFVIRTESYHGLTSASQAQQDFTNFFVTTNYNSMTALRDYNSTTNITTGFHKYFKLEGFNPITQVYETWHCRDVPLFSPPSGHTLQNIVVVTSWIDR